MSHNRKRIPSRVRNYAKEGMTTKSHKIKKYDPRKTYRKKLLKAKTDVLQL